MYLHIIIIKKNNMNRLKRTCIQLYARISLFLCIVILFCLKYQTNNMICHYIIINPRSQKQYTFNMYMYFNNKIMFSSSVRNKNEKIVYLRLMYIYAVKCVVVFFINYISPGELCP